MGMGEEERLKERKEGRQDDREEWGEKSGIGREEEEKGGGNDEAVMRGKVVRTKAVVFFSVLLCV